MIILKPVIIILILFSSIIFNIVLKAAPVDSNHIIPFTERNLYTLSFTERSASSNPLEVHGYCPVIHQGTVSFRIDSGDLIIKACPGLRMLYSRTIDPINAGHIRIVWGIHNFPKGINWDIVPTRREAIGIAVSFGKKINSRCVETSTFIGKLLGTLHRLQRLIDPPQTVVIFLGPFEMAQPTF